MTAETHAIVFDMDGVLIDSHPVHRAAWREFLRSLSVDVSEQDLAFILEGGTRTDILRHFLGELPQAELVDYGRRKDEIFRSMEHEIRAAPGVLSFLRELERSGLARAVATSASEIRTASTIERMGMGGYFDAVITAADVVVGKPGGFTGLALDLILAAKDKPSGFRRPSAEPWRVGDPLQITNS